jgi:hypothetical protein
MLASSGFQVDQASPVNSTLTSLGAVVKKITTRKLLLSLELMIGLNSRRTRFVRYSAQISRR